MAAQAWALPAASLTVGPATPQTGQTVTFTSTSTDPDGPLTATWQVDGVALTDATGTPVTGNVVTDTFATAGTVTVGLTVMNTAAGTSDSTTATFAVVDPPPPLPPPPPPPPPPAPSAPPAAERPAGRRLRRRAPGAGRRPDRQVHLHVERQR